MTWKSWRILFRPYMQEHSNEDNKYGSSGLGLSIVRSLTTLMGGQVSLQSEKGKGSKLSVELPFTVSRESPQVDDVILIDIQMPYMTGKDGGSDE